jgi:hypothetical protein
MPFSHRFFRVWGESGSHLEVAYYAVKPWAALGGAVLVGNWIIDYKLARSGHAHHHEEHRSVRAIGQRPMGGRGGAEG